MTKGQKIIRKIAAEYPSAGNLTIAKLAMRDEPDSFPNIEAARACVRNIRGACGADHRRRAIDQIPSAVFKPGKKRIVGWAPYNVDGPANVLVMSDLHVPYHSIDAIQQAISHAKKDRSKLIDTVLLNGDLLDCHAISFWMTDPRERNFQEEITQCRAFLRTLRDNFPKARIIYKLGNHEERYEAYMIRKAPELLAVDQFAFDTLLKLDDLDIDLVDDKRIVRLGDLNVIHGHEYRFAISNPVNPARGLFLRGKAFAMCGHFHQSSYHTEKTMEESMIATWSIGCLCDLHPIYMPYNNWVHGFAVVEVERGGKFNVQHKVIRSGRIY